MTLRDYIVFAQLAQSTAQKKNAPVNLFLNEQFLWAKKVKTMLKSLFYGVLFEFTDNSVS